MASHTAPEPTMTDKCKHSSSLIHTSPFFLPAYLLSSPLHLHPGVALTTVCIGGV